MFVDGCLWHGCPEHYRIPITHEDYWFEKIGRNVARDEDTDNQLREAGWLPIRIWEHDDPAEAQWTASRRWSPFADRASHALPGPFAIVFWPPVSLSTSGLGHASTRKTLYAADAFSSAAGPLSGPFMRFSRSTRCSVRPAGT